MGDLSETEDGGHRMRLSRSGSLVLERPVLPRLLSPLRRGGERAQATVAVTFPNGEEVRFPRGITGLELIKDARFPSTASDVVAMRLNNNVYSLRRPVLTHAHIAPIELNSAEGGRIYRSTLSFILAAAAHARFENRRLVVSHSMQSSYYFYFADEEKTTDEKDLRKLHEQMRWMIDKDVSIVNYSMAYVEAVQYFEDHGRHYAGLLLRNTNEPVIQCVYCDSSPTSVFLDLDHGPLLPSAGFLKAFDLMLYPPGFILRHPHDTDHSCLSPFVDSKVLFKVYLDYKEWCRTLDMDCVGMLNQHIATGSIRQFIRVAEALHERKIAEIANHIAEHRERISTVLIAGPSSSGKTTFARKLAIQLKVSGFSPVTISLDDYFLPHAEMPRDEHGNMDFEALSAVDIKLLNKDILTLLKGEDVIFPIFDFKTGTRKHQATPFKLPPRAVLIMEGIHGLNDDLTPLIPREEKFKIYVSCLTQLNLDDSVRINTTDNRLIRRMVRDNTHRGHSALRTLKMWPSVRAGENKWIFPFQNTANIAFNSALDFELSVLEVYAGSLLKSIKPDVPEFAESRRLLRLLNNFAPVPSRFVSSTSILREFIGPEQVGNPIEDIVV
eukprot:TRINITY_DN25874_c0_g1_i1.p1 TRINITY_DN25874_c0_g1~~TRINITY_DN25874_c0_g1_i1.p1  ORF type:complete len:657 (+),score=112.62 TRINITY_DN25874_c0_g1_i1:142-1971(+)